MPGRAVYVDNLSGEAVPRHMQSDAGPVRLIVGRLRQLTALASVETDITIREVHQDLRPIGIDEDRFNTSVPASE